MSKTSNRGRVGTLHSLCKQTIKQNEISMDEIEQMVSDFPYDEKSEIEKSKKKVLAAVVCLVKEIILNEKLTEQRMAIINQKDGVYNKKR